MLDSQELDQAAQLATRRIRNYHDREDAQQEYRIAAWRAAAKADADRDPKPYQRTSGRHAVSAFCNKQYRNRAPVSLDKPCQLTDTGRVECLYDVLPAKTPDPASQASARDLVRAVQKMIDKLPPHMRKVMQLQLEGLSTQEICKRLGFTRQAINRNKARARVLLKRKLEANKHKNAALAKPKRAKRNGKKKTEAA